MADDPRDNVVRLSSEPSDPVPIAKPDPGQVQVQQRPHNRER